MLCYTLEGWNAKSFSFVFEFALDVELFGLFFPQYIIFVVP